MIYFIHLTSLVSLEALKVELASAVENRNRTGCSSVVLSLLYHCQLNVERATALTEYCPDECFRSRW